MNGLTGKIAVITGGTQGLGAAIARLFADRGASGIVTCGRSAAKGQTKAKEIQDATGTKVVFVAADLGKVEDCRAVIAKADAEFGRVDVLVNAAGITDRGTILDTSPELFDKIFNVNVRGPFFLMQETIKIMRREKIEGNIVNIGSMSAKAGQPFIAAYCSSKGALATVQPFGRLIDPHEVARAVAFLSTGESGLMTGSMVNYDQSIWGAYGSSPQPESAL